MCRRKWLACWLGFLCLWVGSVSAETKYTLAVVPQFAAGTLHRTWGPLIERLNRQLDFSVVLVTAPDIARFDQLSLQGAYDFAYINPYQILQLNARLGMRPLVADTAQPVMGVLVVRRESDLMPADIAGQRVAFPGPDALGATMMIRRDLKQNFSADVIPEYVNSHSSVYLNVALGLNIAGGGVEKTLAQQSEAVRDKLKVIYRTEPVPSHPLVVHPRVPEADAEALREALLQIAQSADGKADLARIPITRLEAVTFEDYTVLQQLGLEAYYEEQR